MKKNEFVKIKKEGRLKRHPIFCTLKCLYFIHIQTTIKNSPPRNHLLSISTKMFIKYINMLYVIYYIIKSILIRLK